MYVALVYETTNAIFAILATPPKYSRSNYRLIRSDLRRTILVDCSSSSFDQDLFVWIPVESASRKRRFRLIREEPVHSQRFGKAGSTRGN